MTEPTESHQAAASTEAATDELDFERASFDDPSVKSRVCNGCGTPISDVYFTHGSSTICPQCQPTFAQKLGQSSFGAALGYGSLAAAGGALVWYGIRALTDYELGIIAIAVGVAVGIGVRKGAGPSASKVYRIMAVALTYLSIVSTYVPAIAAGMMEGAANDPASDAAPIDPADSDALPEPTAVADASHAGPAEASMLLSVIAYVFAMGIALIMPALLISSGEIMGLVIIAIGLWEAWQRSAPRPEDQIAGPFQINAAGQS